jgi:hypothetical protein
MVTLIEKLRTTISTTTTSSVTTTSATVTSTTTAVATTAAAVSTAVRLNEVNKRFLCDVLHEWQVIALTVFHASNEYTYHVVNVF